MKRFVAAVAVLVLLACSALSAPLPPEPVASTLVFLESTDAQRPLPRNKIVTSMAELVRAMKLPNTGLPRVLVLHVSARAAKLVGVELSTLRRNSGDIAAPYFELWIVGEPDPADYTAALEQLLENHFSLQMTDADRKRLVTRVVRLLDATVDVHGQ